MEDQARPLPERVEGPRLLLRRWTLDDVEALAAAVARNLDHLRPWMPWVEDEPLDHDARRRLIAGWEEAWRCGGDAVYGVFQDGEVAGGCGLHRRRGPHGLEIGYWVDRARTARGVAREVARMLTTAALAVPGVDHVEIHHDAANLASAAIPRRLGYRHVGAASRPRAAPGEIGVDWAWRVAAEDWHPDGGVRAN